jgi:hypothetical protein
MITHYPQQFQSNSTAILKELIPFVNDNDMQASSLALRVAIPVIAISGAASAEV